MVGVQTFRRYVYVGSPSFSRASMGARGYEGFPNVALLLCALTLKTKQASRSSPGSAQPPSPPLCLLPVTCSPPPFVLALSASLHYLLLLPSLCPGARTSDAGTRLLALSNKKKMHGTHVRAQTPCLTVECLRVLFACWGYWFGREIQISRCAFCVRLTKKRREGWSTRH